MTRLRLSSLALLLCLTLLGATLLPPVPRVAAQRKQDGDAAVQKKDKAALRAARARKEKSNAEPAAHGPATAGAESASLLAFAAQQAAITQLAPTSVVAYTKSATLTVTGTGFVTGAQVIFNGNAVPTTVVSATQLQAQLRADDLVAAGSVLVRVRQPNAGDSNQLSFSITPGTLPQAEAEPNDSYATADALPVGGTRTGTVAESDAAPVEAEVDEELSFPLHDIYVLRVTQETRLKLTLQWQGASTDLDLVLLNVVDGAPEAYTWSAFFAPSSLTPSVEQITTRTLQPGRYFIAVSAYEGPRVPYTLSASVETLPMLNAASYDDFAPAAPESIVAAFAPRLATGTSLATTTPLPTQLLGTSVKVKDSLGVELLAPLFFVSPEQINFLVPARTAIGVAEITVTSGDGTVTTDRLNIHGLSPSLFTANSDGRGVPAALALRVSAGGAQRYEPLARLDTAVTPNKFAPAPIDLGPEGEQVFLVLYGTGFRNRTSLAKVEIEIGGVKSPALYVGPAGSAGLDQINVAIPRALRGRGNAEIRILVDDTYFSNQYFAESADAVMVNIK